MKNGEKVLEAINLDIKKGEFVCIIGEVGSGKSSLLQAVLGELSRISSESKVSLNSFVSYAPQQPFIESKSIRDNIVFHSYYDEQKYKQILKVC